MLSNKLENGIEKPIAFASRSLAPAEKKYSQLDKEALAIIFGVKRFHQYLYSRQFTILSDHQPLQHIVGEHKATPILASARIQRWALTLAAYNYHIVYKSGATHGNADCVPTTSSVNSCHITYYLQKMNHDLFGIVNHADDSSAVYLFDETVGPKNTDHTLSFLTHYIRALPP